MPRFYATFAYYPNEDGAFYVNGYVDDAQGTTRRETLFDSLNEEEAQEICLLLERIVSIALNSNAVTPSKL